MRLWTVHPKYLDPKGLVALWREALLARAVLRGETTAYRNHPQLHRFRTHSAPRAAINAYLAAVLVEASLRGYTFDRRKVSAVRSNPRIMCTAGQLEYEWRHLLRKLKARSPAYYRRWRGIERPDPHPMFTIQAGPVEPWERIIGYL